MSENIIQFSSLTVTPHSAYIPEYAFNNGFSFNQATNIICNNFIQDKKQECPVCGKKNCPEFKNECKSYLKQKTELALKKALRMRPYGRALMHRSNEFNESSPLLLLNMKENNIPLNNENIGRIFETDLNLSRMFYQKMNYINGFLFDIHFSPHPDPMLQNIGEKFGEYSRWLPSVRLALHALYTDKGADNINNFPEMQKYIREQDFKSACQDFHNNMTFTHRNFQIADILAQQANKKEQTNDEFNLLHDSVKFTADFYKEVFNAYGDKARKLAESLAQQTRGKTIRNVDDALKAYEKYKADINRRINAKDRKAIATALESIKLDDIAQKLKKFSKGMFFVSKALDVKDLSIELIKATETDNWRPFFVKAETIFVGMAATSVAGFTFSVLLGGPIGILGYGLLIASIGALIDNDLIEKANNLIGI
ncbi:colicin-like pore-forming protein [Proteus sp. DFP240708]|uniref:colicin-like pore-forming protein n=1 Tax=Proteus TaxID=583 RepID=UPI001E5A832D|nr:MULTISPECIES: colicin-like pore-forming protein [Proteus]